MQLLPPLFFKKMKFFTFHFSLLPFLRIFATSKPIDNEEDNRLDTCSAGGAGHCRICCVAFLACGDHQSGGIHPFGGV